MLTDDDDAWAELANVILHESVHATVFIPDEPFFNEGLAEYVADRMADDWLVARFGADSPLVAAYRDDLAERATRTARELAAYAELEKLYASKASDRVKLAEKARIIDQARRRPRPPRAARQRLADRAAGLPGGRRRVRPGPGRVRRLAHPHDGGRQAPQARRLLEEPRGRPRPRPAPDGPPVPMISAAPARARRAKNWIVSGAFLHSRVGRDDALCCGHQRRRGGDPRARGAGPGRSLAHDRAARHRCRRSRTTTAAASTR